MRLLDLSRPLVWNFEARVDRIVVTDADRVKSKYRPSWQLFSLLKTSSADDSETGGMMIP